MSHTHSEPASLRRNQPLTIRYWLNPATPPMWIEGLSTVWNAGDQAERFGGVGATDRVAQLSSQKANCWRFTSSVGRNVPSGNPEAQPASVMLSISCAN